MGARDDLLAAARSLEDRGMTVFAPVQLIAEARALGSTYIETTLRTFILGPMCANSPDHHGVKYGDFERVGRGLYRLTSSRGLGPADRENPGPEALVDLSGTVEPEQRDLSAGTVIESGVDSSPNAADDEWFWEGNVQAMVVAHLASSGWSIRRVANTATSEHGVDIEAERADEYLLVEVKGYPGSTYQRGSRRGETKKTAAPPQARAYFSNALLSGMLMRADRSSVRVALAFPDVPTYRNLGSRIAAPLAAARIEVWFVTQEGGVAPTLLS